MFESLFESNKYTKYNEHIISDPSFHDDFFLDIKLYDSYPWEGISKTTPDNNKMLIP